ncbi:MAG: DUF6377 domain-containing protein [Dysgonomonas sp.]|jgi:hypothetical protein|uniref:DUF6377 domain-containing protein n=1 Tax=unclassified Dysgonomonas TaxID=2630389 RepID=UPI0025BCED93|nr:MULTISPECIES: DUF6377 domain-containing protein [unclassified Dysgonomonas]MDR1718395.1 DUF6377 domain-containing protein [Prevotella sp.]MDR2004283.1 DUF6377 domain-containing protein [Prevotella sp.]HMM03159.1 DUF6377 domain-containing protein [Dysgonomonas sp.]
MKKTLLFLLCIIYNTAGCIYSKNEIDSLLKVLDKTISERPTYMKEKIQRIDRLKLKLNNSLSLNKIFSINEDIIAEYESFACDSAIAYIDKNIEIAKKLDNKEFLSQSKLKLSFVLSLSGSFTQALEELNSIEYKELPTHLKSMYCWTYIRYYENLIKYTDDPQYEKKYQIEKMRYRDTVMSFLGEGTDMYVKEEAFKFQDEGRYNEAQQILSDIFSKQELRTHNYAMSAMSLALVNKYLKNSELEEKYLILAAITDTQLAVKENEALLALAINLYNKGDVNRAYNYIRAALDDANFYNSRFRNTMIARVQPIIEDTYLNKIEQQKKNLKAYAVVISLFVIVLAIALFFIYKQVKIVSRARKNLKAMNEKLASINHKLDEANLIKEKYIGYFMNQCAVYIDKLDDYRKNVNRKIKAGQIDDLYNMTASTRNLEKDVEELYITFDKAFFKIYPNFVEEFNALLKKEERYKLEKEQLNTELRIFALIRLGITDVNQIAVFLRYSVQTIYNYKSKVKGKATIDSENFEEEVKKIEVFSIKDNSI